jgi:hypothetical protein
MATPSPPASRPTWLEAFRANSLLLPEWDSVRSLVEGFIKEYIDEHAEHVVAREALLSIVGDGVRRRWFSDMVPEPHVLHEPHMLPPLRVALQDEFARALELYVAARMEEAAGQHQLQPQQPNAPGTLGGRDGGVQQKDPGDPLGLKLNLDLLPGRDAGSSKEGEPPRTAEASTSALFTRSFDKEIRVEAEAAFRRRVHHRMNRGGGLAGALRYAGGWERERAVMGVGREARGSGRQWEAVGGSGGQWEAVGGSGGQWEAACVGLRLELLISHDTTLPTNHTMFSFILPSSHPFILPLILSSSPPSSHPHTHTHTHTHTHFTRGSTVDAPPRPAKSGAETLGVALNELVGGGEGFDTQVRELHGVLRGRSWPPGVRQFVWGRRFHSEGAAAGSLKRTRQSAALQHLGDPRVSHISNLVARSISKLFDSSVGRLYVSKRDREREGGKERKEEKRERGRHE